MRLTALSKLIPRTASIGNHLRLLALGTLLPVVLFAAGLAILQAQQERETFKRGAHARVVAVSSAIDAELRATVDSLRTLAESQALADGKLEQFHAVALRVKNLHSDWVTVILADAGGQQRVNAIRPYGAELPRIDEVASFEAVVRMGQPTIGSLALGPRGRRQAYPVRVPVVREGRLAYVLTAVVDPAAIVRILREQGMSGDWVASVVDAQLVQVARLHEERVQVGVSVAPAFRDALTSGAAEGNYRGRTLEGTSSYVTWRRSAFSGWAVGIAIPAGSVEAGAWRVLALGLLGIVLALAIALGLARLLARRISEPVALLAAQARALRRSDSSMPQFDSAGVSLAPEPPTTIRLELSGNDAATTPTPALRELRDLQDALDDATEAMHALAKARSEATAANRAKDEFLAMLGHELRNPLSAITAASQLLRTRPEGPATVLARTVLQRQTAHLTRLVDDLLDASRVSLGKIELKRRPLDFAELVQRIAAQVVGASTRHRLDLQLEPAWVSGDDTRLEQIVTNLLSNAVRYSPAGGTITLTLQLSLDRVRLTVCDEGVGMTPELLPRVFDLFVQGERGAARSQGGLGIGLTLAHRLAALHDGSVEAHSDGEGRGSRFVLTLPAMEPSFANLPAAPSAVTGTARLLNVLLVDDNEDGRGLLCEVLEGAGHRVTQASDGLQALELATTATFDVALIDIGLPGLDGLEVARRLRGKGHALAAMPLVAITGYGAPQDYERSRAAGFNLHLVKPLDGFELLEELQLLIRAR